MADINKIVMTAVVFIEPHERGEALMTYSDRLTPEQVEQIEEAPEGALIRLSLGGGTVGEVLVIEEG